MAKECELYLSLCLFSHTQMVDPGGNHVKVYCAEDCGNAPKKALLRDVAADCWGGAGDVLVAHLTGDARRRIVGGRLLEGSEAIRRFAVTGRGGEASELHIHNIITHGNVASLNGTVTMEDGRVVEFCDVYEFAGFGPKARIKEIVTYAVPVT